MLSSNLCFVTRMQDINLEKEAGTSSGSIRTSDHEVGTPPPPPPPPPDNHHLQRLRSGGGGSLGIDSSEITEVRKLPSSQYKGVVPQPNGRWGAQIYEKHHRVWLGTFNDEVDAAKAYDIAAQRFRGRNAVINFSPLSDCSESESDELVFLNSHSKAEIVDMLRKHTYQDELQQSQRRRSLLISIAADTNCGFGDRSNRVPYQPRLELLFEKAVTPSDVGKLNRLVIPKQHAERHFPLKSTEKPIPSNRGSLLNLEDAGGKVWRFRYSYWNSSQSYVLTKGWSRFVKEKRLTAGDVVGFYRSVGPDEKLYIDWKPKNSTGGGCYPYLVLPVPVPIRQVAVVKLFGVNIANGVHDWEEERRRATQYFYKKQCIRSL